MNDWNDFTVIEKIKICLFNPFVFAVLFICTVISGASGNRDWLEYFPSLFLLTVFYPILCKMAYMPLIDVLGIGFFLFVIFWYTIF